MRVYVTKVWESWADHLATDLIYGVLGASYRSWLRDVSVKSSERKRAACFAQSRLLWNRYVTQACNEKYLTELETAARLGCRPSGVHISGQKRKYSCHDPFCPYCQHRAVSRLLRFHKNWIKDGKLDVIAWQVEIPEDDVMEPGGVFKWRATCDYARKVLIKLARTKETKGLVSARLWIERSNNNSDAKYYHQLAIIGIYLNKCVSERAQLDHNLIYPRNIYAEYTTKTQNALSPLRYCPGWLKVSRDVGSRIMIWNRQFRKRPL